MLEVTVLLQLHGASPQAVVLAWCNSHWEGTPACHMRQYCSGARPRHIRPRALVRLVVVYIILSLLFGLPTINKQIYCAPFFISSTYQDTICGFHTCSISVPVSSALPARSCPTTRKQVEHGGRG